MKEFRRRIIVCPPPLSIDQGLRMEEFGRVDPERAREQHAEFCTLLEDWLDYEIVERLVPDESKPDCEFVEDPAVVLPGKVAVVARLRATSRSGEEEPLRRALEAYYPTVRILPPGYLEGGDVLVTRDRLCIGISERTNQEGASQLARIGALHGYAAEFIPIPKDKLHLKGECSYHPEHDFVVASERLTGDLRKAGVRRLVIIPAGENPRERFGANCISSGNKFLVHAGCETAGRVLTGLGFKVRFVDLSEFDKVDGAMTCLWKLV
jgi:dimethylargininase